jgi:PleD family two-component response regulator
MTSAYQARKRKEWPCISQITNESVSVRHVSFRIPSCGTLVFRPGSVESSAQRILVIEDDCETGRQIVDFLSTSGYRIDLAITGHDGLQLGAPA